MATLQVQGTPNTSVRTVGLIDPTTGAQISGPTAANRIPSAAGSNNATVVKASAGRLWHVNGFNAAAAVRYIKFYDKATAPAPATDNTLLALVFALQASVPFSFALGGMWGFPFLTGIGFALVTGASDTDNTAVTAADILGLNVVYS